MKPFIVWREEYGEGDGRAVDEPDADIAAESFAREECANDPDMYRLYEMTGKGVCVKNASNGDVQTFHVALEWEPSFKVTGAK